MGFIRGSLLVIVGIFLFIVLIISGICLTIGNSLSYENSREQALKIFSFSVDESYNSFYSQCLQENLSSSIVIFEGVSISCENITQGKEQVFDSFFNSAYYSKYDCKFFDCIKKTNSPEFLISQQSKDYWMNKFYISLLIAGILSLIIFLLAEKKSNAFLMLGILLSVTSLPFIKLSSIIPFISGIDATLLSVFVSQSSSVFFKFFILGIILIILGVVIKFLKLGFKISEYFQKRKEQKLLENISEQKTEVEIKPKLQKKKVYPKKLK